MIKVYIKFGQVLKLERENKKIALADLSEELKISEENLGYIEAGEVNKLPSELYYNLFTKSYAKALGIDYAKTIDAIKEDLGEPVETNDKKTTDNQTPPSKIPAKPVEKAEPETNWLKKKIIIFSVIIIGLFIAFMAVYKLFIEEEAIPSASPLTDTITSSEDTLIEESAFDETAGVDEKISDYDWDVPEYREPSAIIMTLTAREECWVSLMADGDTALFRNLTPWKEYRVEAKYRLKINIAQPSLVEIKLNDKKVDLSDPQTRRISNVEINQVNLESFLNPPPQEVIDTVFQDSTVTRDSE